MKDKEPAATAFSNAVRLKGREWIVVGLFALALFLFTPSLWEYVEPFDPGPDYRMPYDRASGTPSSDYWHFDRYTRAAAPRYNTLLIGDSVFWGHYVTSHQTLSHYLNELAGAPRFANLGLHEARPVALAGLLESYASGVKDKNVLLHWNPLWLSSPRAELLDPDLPSFNHRRLIPQFFPSIPCYKDDFSPRLGVLVERHVPFLSWTTHLQQAYYGRTDIPSWTLTHPYDNPAQPLLQGPSSPDDEAPEGAEPWILKKVDKQSLAVFVARTGGLLGTPFGPGPLLAASRLPIISLEDFPWGDLDRRSLQWRFFKKVIEVLQVRGNRVFVLLGPFNEYMLTPGSLAKYHTIRSEVEAWLKENGVPYAAPDPLPSNEYADASHPLAAGYERLARELYPRLPR